MKVLELVEAVLEGQELYDVVEVNEYIPVLDKRNIALEVLEECTEEDEGYLQVDQFKKHIYFTAAVLREYVGLEFSDSFETMAFEYDELCQYGVIEDIIDLVSEDYIRAERILAFEEYKLLSKNSIEAQAVKLTNSIADSLGNLSETIGKKVENLDVNKILPKDADINKLLDVLKLLK